MQNSSNQEGQAAPFGPPVPGDQLVSESELETRKLMTRRWWQKKRQDGTGPPYLKLGPSRSSPVRYWLSVATAYLAKCQCTSTSQYQEKDDEAQT